MVIFVCPRRGVTTSGWTSAANISVAAVCRRSWKRMFFTPARRSVVFPGPPRDVRRAQRPAVGVVEDEAVRMTFGQAGLLPDLHDVR